MRNTAEGLTVVNVAAEGKRSAFVRGAAQPLDALADVGQVLADRRPLYVVDAHGRGERAHVSGVAGWRAGIDVGSHAVLPLVVRGHALGVLTIDWAETIEFDDELRDELEGFAALAALGFASFAGAEVGGAGAGRANAVARAAPGLAVADVVVETAHDVTRQGVIVPVRQSGALGADTAIRVWSVTAGAKDRGQEPLVDLSQGPGSEVSLGIGAASCAEDACGLSDDVTQVMRSAHLRSLKPAETIELLDGWLSAREQEVSLDVAIVHLDAIQAAATYAAAGAVLVAVLDVNDRLTFDAASERALGSGAGSGAHDRFAITLPGDIVAIVAGGATDEGEPAHADAVGSALRLARRAGGAHAARKLFDAMRATAWATTVVLIERAGPSG